MHRSDEHGPGLDGCDFPVGVMQFDSASDHIRSVWPCLDYHSGHAQYSPGENLFLIDDYKLGCMAGVPGRPVGGARRLSTNPHGACRMWVAFAMLPACSP